jgi:membrane protease YdiL (CAAX protease family)
MPSALLWFEFLILFVALPLGVRLSPVRLPLLPLLWLATLYCYLVLRADPTFSRPQLWKACAIAPYLENVLTTFCALAFAIAIAVVMFARPLLFSLVRTRPVIWVVVMVMYPIVSVYPQGIVYRAFLMHRYASLFPSQWMIVLVSAAAFGFMHLVFRNPIAVSMTFFGGLLFAWRYQTTHSLALSSLEHALYGCLLFTIGLGQYFYGGTISAPAPLSRISPK